MSFKEIYGHKRQIDILQRAMATNRIPHAYLFYGTAGIGKKTTAVHFAKALNCKGESNNFDACDLCTSCRKIDHQNHPDTVIIEPEGQFIKLQAIREIQKQMRFRPLEGKKRIFIMVDADKMNSPSANALLKTLEEPSASNILILITSRPHLLPLTILSRCQHLLFNPVPREAVVSFLQNQLSLDDHTAHFLASSSGGSIRRAIKMNEGNFLGQRDKIFEELSDGQLQNPMKALAFIPSLGQDKNEIMGSLEMMKSCFRDALVYRETADAAFLIHQDRMDIIHAVADRLSGDHLLHNIKVLNCTSDFIELNANKALTLEMMMFRLNF
jgi:DNA polymerase-3 subunit delta'